MNADRSIRHGAALLLLGCAAGCAGNGEGLDQNGQPILRGRRERRRSPRIFSRSRTMSSRRSVPSATSAPARPKACSSMPRTATTCWSACRASRSRALRVKPGDPDDSYMVHKIEGAAGIDGGQMPLGRNAAAAGHHRRHPSMDHQRRAECAAPPRPLPQSFAVQTTRSAWTGPSSTAPARPRSSWPSRRTSMHRWSTAPP